MNRKYTLFFVVFITLVFIHFYFNDSPNSFAKNLRSFVKDNDFIEKDYSRDFYRYNCKKRIRKGGMEKYISRVPHELYRTEGLVF